jgi:hypothetical protein
MTRLKIPGLALALALFGGPASAADPALPNAIFGYLAAEPIERL